MIWGAPPELGAALARRRRTLGQAFAQGVVQLADAIVRQHAAAAGDDVRDRIEDLLAFARRERVSGRLLAGVRRHGRARGSVGLGLRRTIIDRVLGRFLERERDQGRKGETVFRFDCVDEAFQVPPRNGAAAAAVYDEPAKTSEN